MQKTAVKILPVKYTSWFFGGGLCGSWYGNNIEKLVKTNCWPRMDHAGPYRFSSNCVCVWNQKTLIKSLDINETLPTLIGMDMETPPSHPREATCNSLQEIEICLFVNPPPLLVYFYVSLQSFMSCERSVK